MLFRDSLLNLCFDFSNKKIKFQYSIFFILKMMIFFDYILLFFLRISLINFFIFFFHVNILMIHIYSIIFPLRIMVNTKLLKLIKTFVDFYLIFQEIGSLIFVWPWKCNFMKSWIF